MSTSKATPTIVRRAFVVPASVEGGNVSSAYRHPAVVRAQQRGRDGAVLGWRGSLALARGRPSATCRT